MLYVDLAKAYDSIDRAKLWTTLLHELQLPPDLVAKLQHLYHDIAVQLTGSQDLPPIAVRQGLKQGCPASPLLFSLLFDRVAAYVQAAVGALPTAAGDFYTFHTLQLLLLLFADDVALLARSEAGLGRLYRAFKGFCSQNHLTISSAKTKAMV